MSLVFLAALAVGAAAPATAFIHDRGGIDHPPASSSTEGSRAHDRHSQFEQPPPRRAQGARGIVVPEEAPQRPAGAQATDVNVLVPRFLRVAGAPGDAVAQVLGADGRPVPDGTQVVFSASLGVTLSANRASTSDGLAAVTLFAGSESGFAQVNAASAGSSGAALLWVRPGAASAVDSLVAVPGSTIPGGTVRVTAHVSDAYGNPADGDEVAWHAEGGTMEPTVGLVDHGTTSAVLWVAPGATGAAVVRLEAGPATRGIVVPVAGSPAAQSGLAFLPAGWASGGQRACPDVLVNGALEDGNGDDAPDAWRFEGLASAVAWVDGPMADGALRLGVGGAPARLRQTADARPGAAGAALRLWLRGASPLAASDALRADVWSRVEVAGQLVRAPVLVESLAATEDWHLHILALPVAPRGPTEVMLEPRLGEGAGGLDVARVSLIVCGD